jgi:hypothetical protein
VVLVRMTDALLIEPVWLMALRSDRIYYGDKQQI